MRLCTMSAVAAAVMVVGAGSVRGDDVAPPAWRGQNKTVHAVWDSWANVVVDPWYPGKIAIAPDTYQAFLGPDSPGEYEVPAVAKIRSSITSDGGGILSEWHPFLHPDPSPEEPLAPQWRQGVLAIPLNRADDSVIFQLPNFADDDDPGQQKTVRIQITYQWCPQSHPLGGVYYNDVEAWFDVWAYDALPPTIGMPGWQDTLIRPNLVERHFTGTEIQCGWRTDVLEFTIEPNPKWEEFGLKLRRNLTYAGGWTEIGGWVDQVVIDTICPEPATLGLLLLGGLPLLKRRRARG